MTTSPPTEEQLEVEYFNHEELEIETIPFDDLPPEVQQGLIDCAHLDIERCTQCGSRKYRATDAEIYRKKEWVCPNCGVIEDEE